MSDIHERNRDALDAVRIRRERLYEAVLDVERALSTPAADAPERWAALLAEPVEELREVLSAHVAETEGSGGLFAQVTEEAPRLQHAIEMLIEDHEALTAAGEALAATLGAVHDEAGVETARDQCLDLVRRILVHRHQGAELVYDAYQVDISGAD